MKVRIGHSALISRIAAVLAVAFVIIALNPVTAFARIRVWVDAGHGGKDVGAAAAGLRESDSNLRLTKLVAKAAKRQGWSVGASRTNNSFIDLQARTARAARWRASVFVSIHSNQTNRKSMGFMDIYQRSSRSSGRLATNLIRNLAPLTPYRDLGAKADSRGLAVLRTARMPAVLVEALAVDAKLENASLRNPKFQDNIAEAIVKGIAAYYKVRYRPPTAPRLAKATIRRRAAQAAAVRAKAKASAKPVTEALPTPPKQARQAAVPSPVSPPVQKAQAVGRPTAPRSIWSVLLGWLF